MPFESDVTFATVLLNVVFSRGLSFRPRARARRRPRTLRNSGSILAHPVSLRIESFDQLRKHSHNTDQHFLPGLNPFQSRKGFGDRPVQAGCTFNRRAACIIKKLRPLTSLSPSVAFRSVQQRGETGTIQLLSQLSRLRCR
jgi:hypothetical protein